MLGRYYLNGASNQQLQPGENADTTPDLLPQACDALVEALSLLAAHQAVLDGELPAGGEEAVAAVVNGVWVARQTCDRLAAVILNTSSKTEAESVARWDALAAYFALPDADELIKSLFSEMTFAPVEAPLPATTPGSHPFLWLSTWKAWLRARSGLDATEPAHRKLAGGHRDPHR